MKAHQIREKIFAQELVKNGGKVSKAYQAMRKDVSKATASVNGSRMLQRTSVREHVLAALQHQGVDSDLLASKLKEMLTGSLPCSEGDEWKQTDRAVSHLRAIGGLDAAKSSHMTVDKRQINLNCDASLSDLDKLIKSSK